MRGEGTIRDGQVYYSKTLAEYIHEHEGAECDIDIIIINKPEHYLYKWLFGFLIKEVALHSGNDVDEIKDIMKEKFALEHVKEWGDIPKRHRKKCQRYEKVNEHGDVVDRWHVKSCSSMTHEELLEFNRNCEMHFFDFMNTAVAYKNEKDKARIEEAYENRRKGMMDSKQLKKYKE